MIDASLNKPIRQRELLDCLVKLYSGLGSTGPTSLADGPRNPSSTPGGAGSAPDHRPLRVLLAEDNRINQQFAVALLSKAGYGAVTVVENGNQAVNAVQKGSFDVVLMDVQMPELDGIQATIQIRALPPPKCEVPIIALTANAMSGSCCGHDRLHHEAASA